MIAAGDLDKRISLTPITRGRSAAGETTETPGTPVEVWAKVEPIDPRTGFDDARFAQRPTHKITIRWRQGVKHRDRLTFRGRAFDIVSIHDPDERREALVILAAAREAG